MTNNIPATIDQAVDQLVSNLPIEKKRELADMAETDLINLHSSMGHCIKNKFYLLENSELIDSCCSFAGDDFLNEDNASMLIIRQLWKRLQIIKKLKVVK